MIGLLRAVILAAVAAAIFTLSAAPVAAILAAVPYRETFQSVAGPRWVERAAQAWSESGFDARAVSPVGARGLMQFMPATWKEWAPPGADPFDPHAGIDAGHRYMLWLESRTSSFDAALGSYNAGLGNIRKAQRLAEGLGLSGRDAWLQALPRVTGPAHAKETQGYIAHNRAYRERLRAAGWR